MASGHDEGQQLVGWFSHEKKRSPVSQPSLGSRGHQSTSHNPSGNLSGLWAAPQRPPPRGPTFQHAARLDTPAPRRKPAVFGLGFLGENRGKTWENDVFCHHMWVFPVVPTNPMNMVHWWKTEELETHIWKQCLKFGGNNGETMIGISDR